MSVVRNLFGTFSRDDSNALAAPDNLVCLSDSDRVCDEPDEIAARHGPRSDAATSTIETEPRDGVAPLSPCDDASSGLEVDQSLGRLMTEARKHRGFSREQVASQTNIPAYYVRMIESDSYDAIPDQLYLLPFFERYAIFLGLDARKVVSRFIQDFERSENEIAAPPTSTAATNALLSATALLKSRWRQIAAATAVAVVLVPVIAWSIGTMRTIRGHSADKTPASAISSNTTSPSTTVSADARSPDPNAVPPPIAAASASPQIAEQPHSPIIRQRRRGHGHRLSHHSRRSRRGVS